MSTASERQEAIARIREVPAKVEAAVRGLSEQELDASAGGGEWTLRQVVHHMADAHMNLFVRIKLVLTEDNPILKPFDQERWAELPDTHRVPIAASLDILRGLHERTAALLETLPEADWQRRGVHLEAGLLTLDDLLKRLDGHGRAHLEQIDRLLG